MATFVISGTVVMAFVVASLFSSMPLVVMSLFYILRTVSPTRRVFLEGAAKQTHFVPEHLHLRNLGQLCFSLCGGYFPGKDPS